MSTCHCCATAAITTAAATATRATASLLLCMPLVTLGPLPAFGPLPGLVHRANHRAVTDSGCLCVEPHPFRSREHTTASGAPDEHTLATAVPGSSEPRPLLTRTPRSCHDNLEL